MTRTSRGHRRAGLIVGSLALIGVGVPSAGCSAPQPAISVGMTKSEVRARLGPPERIGVLNGKDIDVITPDAEAHARGRMVYFYRDGRLAVWFERTLVTGITDNTGSIETADQQAEDH